MNSRLQELSQRYRELSLAVDSMEHQMQLSIDRSRYEEAEAFEEYIIQHERQMELIEQELEQLAHRDATHLSA